MFPNIRPAAAFFIVRPAAVFLTARRAKKFAPREPAALPYAAIP